MEIGVSNPKRVMTVDIPNNKSFDWYESFLSSIMRKDTNWKGAKGKHFLYAANVMYTFA